MRKIVVMAVLALAGCGGTHGAGVKYSYQGDSPYDRYRQNREVALTTGADPSRTVPVALPAQAPTPQEIAGPTLMQIIARDFRRRTGQPAPADARVVVAARVAPDPAGLPVATSGPYAGTTPVLVRYAFAARHNPGTAVWKRANASTATAARACAIWPSAERAQLAFLGFGGPDADPRGMDPDGDGFVCGWDPAPYRVNAL